MKPHLPTAEERLATRRGLKHLLNPLRPGAIAQLGERLHGMQEVSGSIPLGSTTSSLFHFPIGLVWNVSVLTLFCRRYETAQPQPEVFPATV
jgi:hypothetical protein